MNCSELEAIGDIVKIEAYDLSEVTLSLPYTSSMVIPSSAVGFTGKPIALSLKQDSARASCVMSSSEKGDIYKNTLSYETDDMQSETLRQVGNLTAGGHHYLLTTYSGARKLLFNWCGFGRTFSNLSLAGSEDSLSVSFSIDSRLPILTLI